MATVSVKDEFEASVEVVWDLISDFTDISAWAPQGNITQVEGEGIGAVRRVEAPGMGGVFRERCEDHDPQARRFSYSVLESPVPMKNYVAVVTLSELGPERCGIEWACTFEPVGAPEAEIVQGIEATYGVFIGSIKETLAQR
jgi:mxaD protein